MEKLKYLFGAYLNEDWYIGHDSWQSVVDEFMTDYAPTVRAVPGEIDALLSSVASEQELTDALFAMGCGYAAPEGDAAWLRSVRDYLLAKTDVSQG